MRIAIVGAGNMGQALLKGFKAAGEADLWALNPVNPKVAAFAKKSGIELVNTPADLVAAKPGLAILTTPAPLTVTVAGQLADLPSDCLVVSSAAGVSIVALEAVMPQPVSAIIPNIPVASQAGTIGLTMGTRLSAAQKETVTTSLKQLGTVVEVKEDQLGIVGTVGGCGPAFVDVMMDALADAAVKHGLDRASAYQVAVSMVAGSGQLALESGLAPALLRDQVASPGGTTIQGISALEAHGFRAALIAAVDAAMGKEE